MKPEVKYSKAVFPPDVGGRALIYLAGPHHSLDDHYLDDAWYEGRAVTTSKVLSVEENGDFETLNTKYIKVLNEV